MKYKVNFMDEIEIAKKILQDLDLIIREVIKSL